MKKLKRLAALAKAAFDAETAKGDKSDAALLVDLKSDMDSTAAAVVAQEQADAKAAEQKDEKSNVIELEAVKAMIETAVKTTITEKLPEHLKDQVTEASVKAIIEAALAKAMKTDEKTMTPAQVQAVVADAVSEQLKAIKLPSKHQFAGGGKAEGGRTEIPYSLCKGNLPLHMEQLKNCLLRRDRDQGIDAGLLERGKALGDHLFADIKVRGAKALTTVDAGAGLEWQPRDLSSELYRRLYLESKVAQAFMDREVQMPTDPYDYPLLTTNPVFFLNTAQNTETDASNIGTGKLTLATVKLMAMIQYSYEADEDTIIPILPTIQDLLAKAAARALENAIINGDTTATHMDSDVTDPKDQRKAWKGFRKLALAVAALKTDLAAGGITRANSLAVLKLLGKYGANASDLLWITGSKGWTTLLGLDEYALGYLSNRTGGSFFQGGLTPSPWGGNVLVSEQSREDLNAAGVYDGATTTKGSLLLVNKGGFILGSRREFTVETQKNIRSQTNDIVASFRKAFIPVETPSATISTAAIGYNYNA